MPSVSKKQRRFMGMVAAYKDGSLKNPSPEVKRAAMSMDNKQVRDFASTSEKGLPNRKRKKL